MCSPWQGKRTDTDGNVRPWCNGHNGVTVFPGRYNGHSNGGGGGESGDWDDPQPASGGGDWEETPRQSGWDGPDEAPSSGGEPEEGAGRGRGGRPQRRRGRK